MEITENIQAQDTQSQIAEAKGSEGENNGNVSLGKFKDVNSLINAYNSLQSEFTRRSQKLKELEGAAGGSALSEKTMPGVAKEKQTAEDNQPPTYLSGDKGTFDGQSGFVAEGEDGGQAEKPTSVPSDLDLEKEVEEFLNKYPEASKFSKDLAETAAKNQDFGGGFLSRAYMQVLRDEYQSLHSKLSDDNYLLELADSNSLIKDMIIKNYLDGIKKGGKVSLLSDIGSGVTMPVKRPATIEEAGLLAKEILKKK